MRKTRRKLRMAQVAPMQIVETTSCPGPSAETAQAAPMQIVEATLRPGPTAEKFDAQKTLADLLDGDGLESESAKAALDRLARMITTGSASEMRIAGEKGMIRRGNTRHYIHATIAEEALAWCARHFASRADVCGDTIDCSVVFEGMGGAAVPPLTKKTAAAAVMLLRDVLTRGDSHSILWAASLVQGFWGDRYTRIPRLAALTWSAHVLGDRFTGGKLGELRPATTPMCIERESMAAPHDDSAVLGECPHWCSGALKTQATCVSPAHASFSGTDKSRPEGKWVVCDISDSEEP